MAASDAEREALLRQHLFVPCDTKEHLKDWVTAYLGIELPDCTVCDDDVDNPPSNSNPMELLWEVYQAAREGKDPAKTQYLYYASRDSWKSLVTTIIEVLCLLHLNRDCAHLAAVLSQAKNVQRYLKKFFQRPVLNRFLTSKNEMTVEVTRYEKGGEILSPLEWKALAPEERDGWKPRVHFVQIIVATLSGTNSLHCSMVIMDELDLAPPGPVEEAMMIASPGQERGELPMVIMTSSRKFGHGLVQDAIDHADERGINLRHWNLVDSAKACPSERHLPHLPRLPIYYSEKSLTACDESSYAALPRARQEEYKLAEGYAGCLQNCRIFAQCRGRLATKQKSTSPLLKSIDAVQATFKRVTSVEKAQAQLLCWRPSTEGMIYASLDREIHIITAAQAAELFTGEEQPGITKLQFVELLKQHDAQFAAGLDWGFAHPFGGVLGAKAGLDLFIFDGWEIPELTNSQQLQVCLERLSPYDPDVYADTAYPGMIKEFKQRGFRMRKWKKYAGSVLDGIEAVRQKVKPVVGRPQLYFIKGDDIDPGVDLLFKRLAGYHWKTDSEGKATNIPNDTEDDGCDAVRYLVMNLFGRSNSRVMVGASEAPSALQQPMSAASKLYDPQNWMRQLISHHTGQEVDELDHAQEDDPSAKKGKSGSFFYDMG